MTAVKIRNIGQQTVNTKIIAIMTTKGRCSRGAFQKAKHLYRRVIEKKRKEGHLFKLVEISQLS